MQEAVLRAFRVVDRGASEATLRKACRDLFLHSEEFQFAKPPFDESEIEQVTEAIYGLIDDPEAPGPRMIRFTASRIADENAIEHWEYASGRSQELLYVHEFPRTRGRPADANTVALDELRAGLKRYIVALLYRYQYCCYQDDWLPISVLRKYLRRVHVLLAREQRTEQFHDAVMTTLEAFESLEHSVRREAQLTAEMHARQQDQQGD